MVLVLLIDPLNNIIPIPKRKVLLIPKKKVLIPKRKVLIPKRKVLIPKRKVLLLVLLS